MIITVSAIGLALAFCITIAITLMDSRARKSAWKRISGARTQNRIKEERLIATAAAAPDRLCKSCPLGTYFRDQYGE
jgi:hypothetical protein